LFWGPGASDGAAARHFGLQTLGREVRAAVAAIGRVVADDSAANRARMYRLLMRADPIHCADDLLDALDLTGINRFELTTHTRWLLRQAAHREVAKLAIVLLGQYGEASDLDDIQMFGRHEEFTLYAAVALSKLVEDPRDVLWTLAKAVDGWGRIHTVERLCEIVDDRPDIRDWLIRKGFQNSIMDEYLAYPCAMGGRLHELLRAETIDDELLQASLWMMMSLFAGGPAADIASYPHSLQVATRLHDLVEKRELNIEYVHWGIGLRRYLEPASGRADSRREQGWTPRDEQALRARAYAFLAHPAVAALVAAEFAHPDRKRAMRAWSAAQEIGIDLWEGMFNRLKAEPGDSFYFQESLRCAIAPARMEQILDWAEAHLPLEEVATGPALEYGLGAKWAADISVGMALRHMVGEVGLRPRFVLTALKSRVISTRNGVLRVLAQTPRADWPAEVPPALHEAAPIEPDAQVKRGIEALIRSDLSLWPQEMP
jgi:hypothetical protein